MINILIAPRYPLCYRSGKYPTGTFKRKSKDAKLRSRERQHNLVYTSCRSAMPVPKHYEESYIWLQTRFLVQWLSTRVIIWATARGSTTSTSPDNHATTVVLNAVYKNAAYTAILSSSKSMLASKRLLRLPKCCARAGKVPNFLVAKCVSHWRPRQHSSANPTHYLTFSDCDT